MSDDMKQNPYNSPAQVYGNTPSDYGVERPSGLTAVGVIGIILGVMNALAVVGGIAGLFINRYIKDMLPNVNPKPGSMEEAQLKMQFAIQEVSARFFFAHLVLIVVTAIVAFLLIRGGVGAVGRNPSARTLFVYGLVVATIQEIINGIVTTMIQMETFAIMRTFTESIKTGNAQEAEVVQMAMAGGMIFGMLIAVGWIILKLVYFIVSLRLLNKPQVLAYYDSELRG
jgi:hypothetical protein